MLEPVKMGENEYRQKYFKIKEKSIKRIEQKRVKR